MSPLLKPKIRELLPQDWVNCYEVQCQSTLYPWAREAFKASFYNPMNKGWVWEEENIKAFALCQVVPPEAEILYIAVSPTKQKQGIAQALLKQCFQWPQVYQIYLEVSSSNHAAIHLYKKLNFIKISERKDYYLENDKKSDAFVFKREC